MSGDGHEPAIDAAKRFWSTPAASSGIAPEEPAGDDSRGKSDKRAKPRG